MENFLILISIIAVCFIIVAPFIILMKIYFLKRHVESMESSIQDVGRTVEELKRQSATKEEIHKLLCALEGMTDKQAADTSEDEQDAVPVGVEWQEEEVRTVEPEVKIVELETAEVFETVPDEDNIPYVAANDGEIYSDDDDERPSALKNLTERILGDNWLSKVGIVTLVLGISFFVKYAIDRNWINEAGRVGIGILAGGLIIAIAHKLKSKYSVFSSILVGGGISILYITITLAFREYTLLNQSQAFALLIGITLFSVALSILYDRKELAVFSLLGGFSSPLMVSSGVGNYIVLFSYIFILNSGMLVLAFVKRWRILGRISYILTLAFFWIWAFLNYKDQFAGATVFAVLFYAQFYLLAILDHFKSGNKLTAYHAFLILSNNLAVFLACLYIFDSYTHDVRGLITVALAVVNAIVMLGLFRKSKVDSNLIYMLIAIVMSFISLAIPIQLQGHVITMFWAAEAVILLWLWQKSRIKIFRAGFLLISLLMLVSYAIDIHDHVRYGDVFPMNVLLFWIDLFRDSHYEGLLRLIANRVFITGLVVTASFVVNNWLLMKERGDSSITIGRFKLTTVAALARVFRVMIIVLAFMVPYLELNYQLGRFLGRYEGREIIYMALGTYMAVFVAALGFIYRKRIADKPYMYGLLFLSLILYVLAYIPIVSEVRANIYLLGRFHASYFLIHLISLPAVAYIVFLLIKNLKKQEGAWFARKCWALVILSVAVLTAEVNNLVILCLGNGANYIQLLHDMHTFGYPLLWGVIAMILMIWGMNGKELILRKISLIFFGLIILKFYAYDVWRMSQTSRIISFTLLGVILLLVSFLQQKIKTLIRNENELDNNEEDSSSETKDKE